MNSDNDTTLRKAAILVASLDPASADALLATIPVEQERKLRRAASNLRDVDPDEQRRIVEEFKQQSAGRRVSAVSEGVELDPALAEKLNTGYADQEPTPPKVDCAAPFSFLRDASPEQIVVQLRSEHPQTVAVVLSYLDPEQAADVLPRFPEQLQAEVMRRLIDLDDTDPGIVGEIESQLEAVLTESSRRAERRKAGLETIGAIFEASGGVHRKELIATLARRNPGLLARLGYLTSSASPGEPDSPKPEEKSDRQNEKLVAGVPRNDSAQDTSTPPFDSPNAVETVGDVRAQEVSHLQTFDDLASLTTLQWTEVLGQAEPSVVLLALAAAPDSLVERVVRWLPPREGRRLRRQLAEPGPLWLPDIETAQETLVGIAQELAARGKIGQQPAMLTT